MILTVKNYAFVKIGKKIKEPCLLIPFIYTLQGYLLKTVDKTIIFC